MKPYSRLSSFQFDETLARHGAEISRRLAQLELPTGEMKALRMFPMAEAAHYLGVSPNNLKRLHLEGKGPVPTVSRGGRRFYTGEQMRELRFHLDKTGKSDAKRYLPHRKGNEKLQIVAVANFRSGPDKTVTAAHLAQHLALTGHRTLAVDLDSQAPLSVLQDAQTGLENHPSLYDVLRYKGDRKSIFDVIRPTAFPDLDVIPASLKLQEYDYDASFLTTGRHLITQFGELLMEVDDRYDVVVVNCPLQIGCLTLTALNAASAMLVPVHPRTHDLMSMSQFLVMLGKIIQTARVAGINMEMDWLRYLITRYEPADVQQAQMVGFLQSILAECILTLPMLKLPSNSDADLIAQTLYEVGRDNINHGDFDCALERMDAVNFEIQSLIHRTWGRVR